MAVSGAQGARVNVVQWNPRSDGVTAEADAGVLLFYQGHVLTSFPSKMGRRQSRARSRWIHVERAS